MTAARMTATPRVAYQGEPGAYGEQAIAREWGGAATAIGAPTFRDALSLLGSDGADFAMIPVWNSTIGDIQGTTVWMLAGSRFLLGAGEGGGFPAATKVIAEWFPVHERSTAMGIVNAGTAVGAVVAPPGIAVILIYGGWRWIFVACGAVGLVWAVFWSRTPAVAAATITAPEPAVAERTWVNLLTLRPVWGLVSAKFLTDAAWFFYIAWLPKYLYDARGFDVKQVGYYAWVPYFASGIGSLTGGWFSSWLIARGRSVDLSRKLALGLSATMMPVIIFVTRVPVEWAIALFSIAFFGQQSWSTLVMIVPTDLFERRVVASVAGLVGFGGAMGGLVMNFVAGRLLDLGFGYQTVFSVVGTLHVLAFCVILLTIRQIRPLPVSAVK